MGLRSRPTESVACLYGHGGNAWCGYDSEMLISCLLEVISLCHADVPEGGICQGSLLQSVHNCYVTLGNIYQESNHCFCPHVDPQLSPPTAQWWVSMCIRPIYVHIYHLEVFAEIEME